MYDSDPTISSDRKTKTKREVSALAQESFEAFEPFINIFDPGIRYLDDPIHSIRKEDWRLFERHKQGEKVFHEDGREFSPYLDIIQNIYSPLHVDLHIRDNEISYYTSGTRGLGLVYGDLDAHKEWQTDQADALRLLNGLFPESFHRRSFRGENKLIKVRYNTIKEFNDIADRLETAVQNWFLQNQILCDFEIKGTTTTKQKSGKLAKLPFSEINFRAKETSSVTVDDWDQGKLQQFVDAPILPLHHIRYIIKLIEDRLDPKLVKKGWAKKQRFIEHDKAIKQFVERLRNLGWNGSDEMILSRYRKLKNEQNGKVQLRVYKSQIRDPQLAAQLFPASSDATSETTQHLGCGHPTKQSRPKVSIKSTDDIGTSDGDAFARNWKDLLPFTRNFYRKHRRFPEVEDSLVHLRDNGLFSGCWDDHASRRESRVGQILAFIEQTFDPDLLKSNSEVNLKAGKYMWWVSRKFGQGLSHVSRDRRVRDFDPVSMTAPVTVASSFVPAGFIDTFLVVADFCLNHDPLENKAVPTNRFRELWKKVVGGASWNQRYFQIIRDLLHNQGVINIYDQNHAPGKSWRWLVGDSFPADNWKEEQQQLKKKQKRLNSGIPFDEFISCNNYSSYNFLHNSLYQNAPPDLTELGTETAIGPRPDI